jgi:hypothetical protein
VSYSKQKIYVDSVSEGAVKENIYKGEELVGR